MSFCRTELLLRMYVYHSCSLELFCCVRLLMNVPPHIDRNFPLSLLRYFDSSMHLSCPRLHSLPTLVFCRSVASALTNIYATGQLFRTHCIVPFPSLISQPQIGFSSLFPSPFHPSVLRHIVDCLVTEKGTKLFSRELRKRTFLRTL
ncbi:unnamed protein product [Calicophoron daubneyi]|uniref:Secreted protein n=1 Tax=Calicophoron daubneyi TaxID=300641 RepID=A0AAV2T0U9_CALDB